MLTTDKTRLGKQQLMPVRNFMFILVLLTAFDNYTCGTRRQMLGYSQVFCLIGFIRIYILYF